MVVSGTPTMLLDSSLVMVVIGAPAMVVVDAPAVVERNGGLSD